MDQSRYNRIQKEPSCLNSHVLSSSFVGDSWEEQAFAEDAAGALGGCIWPPRSYTCSFCRREFRSAQALGGHMNVHRRDRAKLKQISSSSSSSNNNIQVLENPNTSFDRCVLQNPIEICNPNFELDQPLFTSSSPRPSTVSALRPFTCSFGQEQQKSSPILSWSKLFEPRKRFHIEDFGNQDLGCATKVLESNSTNSNRSNHQNDVLFAGKLNSLVRKRCETPIFTEKDDAHDGLIFKKQRIDDGTQSFFLKHSNLTKGDEVEPMKRSPNSTLENLDLELRLGDRP